jgi:NADH-quinone oxidoreductase subunit L
MEQLAILIPLLPIIGFMICGLFGKKLPKGLVGVIASGAVLGSFILALLSWMQVADSGRFYSDVFNWVTVGQLKIHIAFQIDQLSSMMMLIITGIGFLIHIYSIGYMHDDEGFYKFFAYLNLFIFSMLLLVMGSNFLILFFGWEGVGLCSYLLIGFWFKNKEYGKAARKAFIMNRIGDLGLLLGIFMIFQQFGSIEFKDILDGSIAGSTMITMICILLFVGAMGKSAQIPLYTWLPDAMAGPTPVSALIHAATMVTAGIYLICRSSVLFNASPDAAQFVLWIGLLTAMFAATIGLKQNDIKKVLAYSTVSQLGYMFVALGVGAYSTAMFHVTTHAFFKALLFLGSGSVIHAMSGEQDIRKMGGLKKALPITHLTFLLGTIAISGVPFFSGYFSKDEILTKAYYGSGPLVFILLCITSVLTAVYMFRLYFLTFHGSFRGSHEQQHHLHESPKTITIPLIILAVLSVIGGFIGMPEWMNHILGTQHVMDHWLEKAVHNKAITPASEMFEYTVLVVSIIVLFVIYNRVKNYYLTKGTLPESDRDEKGVAKVLSHKYYIDELYDKLFAKPLEALSVGLHSFVEKYIIDGGVNGLGRIATESGKALRFLQSGKLELYILGMVMGLLLIFIMNFLIK